MCCSTQPVLTVSSPHSCCSYGSNQHIFLVISTKPSRKTPVAFKKEDFWSDLDNGIKDHYVLSLYNLPRIIATKKKKKELIVGLVNKCLGFISSKCGKCDGVKEKLFSHHKIESEGLMPGISFFCHSAKPTMQGRG